MRHDLKTIFEKCHLTHPLTHPLENIILEELSNIHFSCSTSLRILSIGKGWSILPLFQPPWGYYPRGRVNFPFLFLIVLQNSILKEGLPNPYTFASSLRWISWQKGWLTLPNVLPCWEYFLKGRVRWSLI